jgi:hypothetical protein
MKATRRFSPQPQQQPHDAPEAERDDREDEVHRPAQRLEDVLDVGPGQAAALEKGTITHDGDEDPRRHFLNARLRKVGRDDDGRGRCTLEKAGPGRLIDACVASVLAVEAAAQIPEGSDLPLAVFV